MGIADRISKGKPRRFASSRLIRFLEATVLLMGLAAPVAGVAYAINGATQAQADVKVTVAARTTEGLNVRGPANGDSKPGVPVPHQPGDRILLGVSGVEGSHSLEADKGSLVLRAWGSTVSEQLLSRGDSAILGLSVGAGALLVRRLLLSIAEGEPFRQGNAARIAGIAALTAGGSVGAALTPGLAGGLVLERLGLDGADSPVVATEFSYPMSALLVALLLLAVAEAFRKGTELARDVDGLV
jgi:hypothetical protein